MTKRRIFSSLLLIFTAMIWGSAFVAQDKASEYIGAFTINAIRFIIGAIALIPVIIVSRKIQKKPVFEQTNESRKPLILGAVICGTALAIAANFQQFGIGLYPDSAATSGRAGFITAMYVIIVPIISFFAFKKKLSISLIIALFLSLIGLYLLCMAGGFGGIYIGDAIVLCCALCFAIQILAVDYFVDKVDPIKLSGYSFFVCGLISTIFMFIFEKPQINEILPAWKSILFLGLGSTAIAYTCQIIAQKFSDNPTVASILMSLESVFAAIFGALISNEVFTTRELFGCIIMFIAIILAQIPPREKKNKKA